MHHVLQFLLTIGVVSAATPVPEAHWNHPRALTIASNLPSPWSYLGCQSDNVEKRTLNGAYFFDKTVKASTCISYCSLKGYIYAGTSYSDQCYCGNALGSSISEPEADCSMGCAADATEACGGSSRISLYWNGQPPPPAATTNPGPGNWTSVGCYVDQLPDRTLAQQVATLGGGPEMSVQSCTDACFQEGFMYAGLQYSSECYCSNFINGKPAEDNRCSMLCNGNPGEYCGGSYGLSIYGYGLPKAPVECPKWDAYNQTMSDGSVVLYECYVDHAGSDLSWTYEQSYESCATTCTQTYGCQAFSWQPPQGGPCYMKSSVGASLSNDGVWGGRILNSVATPPKPSAAPSSTVSAGPRPSPTGPLGCPEWDQFNYTTSNGAVMLADCYADHGGGDLSMSYVFGYGRCADSCLATLGCVGFSFIPPVGSEGEGPCYLKNSIGPLYSNAAVWGGQLLTLPPPTNSATNSFSSLTTDLSASGVASSMPSSTEKSDSLVSPTVISSVPVSFGVVSSAAVSSSVISSTTTSSSSQSESSSSSSSSDISSFIFSAAANASQTMSSSSSSISSIISVSPTAVSSTLIFSATISSNSQLESPSSSSNSETSFSAFSVATNASETASASSSDISSTTSISESSSSSDATATSLTSSSFFPNATVTANSSVPLTTSAPPSSSSASLSSSAASSSTSSSAAPTFTYAGCYTDNYAGYGRVMKNEQPDNATLTMPGCIATCQSLGYTVAAAEYARQCFCDNALKNGAPQAPETDCNIACAGDASTNCGAGDRLSVWSLGPLTVMPIPAIPKTNLPQNWTYAGCMFDSVTAERPLGYKNSDKNNTVANCINACQKFGFPAAGVEYGEECYCGYVNEVLATGPQIRPDAECNMPCAGNASELCGTGGRLQTYYWNSSMPLNDWHYGEDSGAGEYKYMMGGLVIPLMATLGINNKVSFLEKHGTGPPNSTGAYEYDYSIEDYQTAWREQHVKTDVFCAASLILPDKSGRQLNVGGWSTDVLSGIRLYTPDGSPGQPSINDWQENVQELKLQNGRWYPTAMVMANGTIVVVGGQDGSNGPPVPTLELLPKMGGALYMDWLRASDPLNLYPFMAVQRGGIFVQYWNEARILDENTFDTIRVLPPVPGAVNAPQGGRSYPLEGTMVLLPQHAPYTESLEVLICGGSTVDNAALDNCVSIKAEDAGADWVLERMPSKRVMTCMAALPDGTYLMVGGAQRGQAGFALADMPNLNALLYDPRKPVGSRMTVMANTTIERMYHSEAILLNDGRVMISGSDPQDVRFPQQYIIEQFLPPYLLNGKPKPSFQAAHTDWNYGETITITNVAAPNWGTGSVQFSMLGAVSSTHSNSMGQRTLFPAVSCSGSTCTITAPPEAHIAPPGWFQLFAVDDGQPSDGVWVRLGKDPGEMGGWPAGLPDFAPLPGV